MIRDGILPLLPSLSCGGSFAAVNGNLVFPGRDENGCELWRSDGVTAGLFRDINPGPPNSMWPSSTAPFASVSGLVLFGADDGSQGLELWATDGDATAQMVQDIASGAAWSTPRSFTEVGPLVFFSANDSVRGAELWAISKSALHRALNVPDTDVVASEKARVTERDASSGEFGAFVPIIE
jgi:ELWxxDGT repeat protein